MNSLEKSLVVKLRPKDGRALQSLLRASKQVEGMPDNVVSQLDRVAEALDIAFRVLTEEVMR